MACLRRYLFCLLITAPSLFAAGIESAMGATISFVPGWTLAGNGSTGPITVASTSMFGDPNKVVTVWKWVSSKGVWAFYTPGIADGGAAFAASKGYDALTTINGGEGFWVNAKTAFTATLPTGSAVTSASFQSTLPAGWSLIAIGDSKAPRDFDIALSTTPPAPGVIPTNLTTLWAWDPTQSNWYFYAPALDANATLSSYVASKSYLSFGTKVLDPTLGFWVNMPATATSTPTTAAPTTTTLAPTTTTTTKASTTTTTSTTTSTAPVTIIYTTPASGSADYSSSFSITETGEANFTLTAANPRHLSTSDYIDLPVATQIWTFTAAEYAVNIYMLDQPNAQLFLNNASFQGYLIGGGQTGLDFMTLPAGRYWIGTVPGQSSPGSTYSNRVFHEVAFYALPNWVEDINVPLGTGMVNPRGWVSKGFTIGSGDYRAYLETEGMGGTFAVMTAAQYASFQAANSGGLSNGGSYSYIYACGNSSGGAATEIECELKLPAGTYYLVYLNDQSTAMGGAANIQFYRPN